MSPHSDQPDNFTYNDVLSDARKMSPAQRVSFVRSHTRSHPSGSRRCCAFHQSRDHRAHLLHAILVCVSDRDLND
jgi:hypothetical protein